MVKMKRSRSWCFTLNNPTKEEEETLQRIECKYLLYGREVAPGTKTPHLQGYVYVRNKKSLKQMKKLIPRSHLEVAKGDVKSNQDYCMKDGDYWSKGTPPKGGGSTLSQAQKNKKLMETSIEELVSNGDISILTIPALVKARYLIGLVKTPLTRGGCCGFWIYGPPGTGKTHYAEHLDPGNVFKKPQNKWWDGYNYERTVLLDDLDTPVLGHYLKIWMDKWPCSGEIKGGTVALRHTLFVVTSNYTPEVLFEDATLAAAVRRRCTFREIKERRSS